MFRANQPAIRLVTSRKSYMANSPSLDMLSPAIISGRLLRTK